METKNNGTKRKHLNVFVCLFGKADVKEQQRSNCRCAKKEDGGNRGASLSKE